MTRGSVSVVGTVVVALGLAAATGFAERGQTAGRAAPTPAQTASPGPTVRPTRPVPAASHVLSPALSAREQSDLVKTYCATCHSERAKAGGLSLAGFDAMKAHEQQDVVEKMIRKLSAGLMPPPGAKRPEAAMLASLTSALEGRMDEYAAANPNPGRRTFQRINRADVERAIADLLALDVDAANWLPLDQKTIANRMKDLGYATCAVGRWHLGRNPKYLPMSRGFAEVYGTVANTPFVNPPTFVDSRKSPDITPIKDDNF